MDWFKTVKVYYDKGFYTNDNVKVFVVKNKITSEQYELITNEEFSVE
ncbi:XkdX family protein [Paenibacillus chitinolyticus]|uniref:XkdX family protein n=1 Tax=Paenibacillus chitinolyticus TaxID=79263 RepID=A0A410WWZ2_9BACL|nr:XkdX family protein [Paenibacillus chitinolyticus]MCY9591443.1 XkdX family protein [Paenibacillus chitinolyticus]MCY9598569.1 XkdX family protein [Paenibacillus chitinolyticus]QAV18802.1 XkdX family protein [Paenibacillus chitinolyticus]